MAGGGGAVSAEQYRSAFDGGPRSLNDPFHRLITLLHHLDGRNPQCPDTPFAQPGVAPFLALRPAAGSMTPSVDLHREPGRSAIEVDDVRTNRMLPTEHWPSRMTGSQPASIAALQAVSLSAAAAGHS